MHFFDVLAAIVFAVSGALVASRKGMDVMGFIWLAVVTGVGGGTMRDLSLGVPVFWVLNPVYVSACHDGRARRVQIRARANLETGYAHIMRGFATVALLVAVVGSALSAQTLRDRVREFGREHPNEAYRFPLAPVDFPGPQTIEEIAQNAEVVVQCKLTKGDTHLVADEVVVTDYVIVEPFLLAGRFPQQQTSRPSAPTTPMTLSVWGGKMVVDGVPVEAEGGYAPKGGSTYVLFLHPARRSTLRNSYELYAEGIFEIDGDRVIPLFRDATHVFGGTIDRNVNAFTARIRNAVRAR